MNLQSKIGSAIRNIRKQRGLTQENLAIESKVDRRYLSDVENGRRNVSLEVIERLCSYFDMPVSSFLRYAEQIENNFCSLDELRDYLVQRDLEEAIVFDSPDYIDAIIGISEDGRVAYSYERMVQHLIFKEGMTGDDAVDFISYNTIRAIPYMGAHAPIIIYDFSEI